MMKRILLAAVLGLLPSVGRAAIVLVASTSKGSTGGTATAVTTDAVDTTGANLLVVSLSSYSAGYLTISDSKSNTWTALTGQANSGDANYKNRLYYCASPNVGSGHTFTYTGAGAVYPTLSALAFSGAHTSPFDLETGSASGTGTSAQPGSLTPSEANCVVVTGVTTNGSSHSTNDGFTATATNAASSNHMGGGIAYLIQTSAAAANPTWSWTTSSPRALTIASFKAAGGGGSTVRRQAIIIGSLFRLPRFYKHGLVWNLAL